MLSLDEVEKIVRSNQDSIVIVDEAYIDFGGVSALSLVPRYENLLVVQTFSKSRSMAGIRIGFAIGNPRLIRALNDVKYSYNSYTMNMPSLILGKESCGRTMHISKKTLKKIIETREWSKKQLERLGFTFPDSMSNFIFASHKTAKAEEIFEALRENQIFGQIF